MKFRTTADGHEFVFEIKRSGNRITVVLDGTVQDWDCVRLTPYSYSILTGGKSHYLSVTEQLGGFKVVIDQRAYQVQVKDEADLLLEKFGIEDASTDMRDEIRAPIPGLISKIFVKADQTVKKGDKLMILEAMKMENEITSSVSGKVDKVSVSQEQSVEKDALLVSMTRDPDGN